MLGEDASDFGLGEPGGAGWRWGAFEQRPQPGIVGSWRELEQLRKEAVELLAQPVGDAGELFAQLVFQAG